MAERGVSQFKKLYQVIQANRHQLKLGSYAAELSFYIIWAIIPVMLTLANVIAILPVEEAEILRAIQQALPDQVEQVVLPLLEGYLANTSTGIFSLGLVISLWPASNVFNTLQRVLNLIYKAEARKNFFIGRAFAYVITLAIVLVMAFLSFMMVFGEMLLHFFQDLFEMQFGMISAVLQQSWLVGSIVILVMMIFIYFVIPNVRWPIKYAVPGSIVAFIGFVLISQLFTLYLSFASNTSSNTTIGVFIVLIIWLYFNAMVIVLGGFVNVLYHDLKEKSYGELVQETRTLATYQAYSDGFQFRHSQYPGLEYQIERAQTDWPS